MGVRRGQRLRGWYRTPEGLCGSALSSAVSGSRQPFEQDVPCGERMGWARAALYCQIHRVEALLPPPGPPECVTRGGLIPPTLCQGSGPASQGPREHRERPPLQAISGVARPPRLRQPFCPNEDG